jgi:beta-galactosidase
MLKEKLKTSEEHRSTKVLEDLFVKPDFDNEKIIVTFSNIDNYTTIEYTILDGQKRVNSGTVEVDPSELTVSFEVDLPAFKPWSAEHPFLYLLQMELVAKKNKIEVEQLFAMTKIHVKDRQIYFNNKPFYIRGYIRGREAHDHPNLTDLSTKEYYEKNTKMAKAYGFNFIRFHSRIPADEFLEVADRLGIFCHVEIRKYYGKYQKEDTSNFECDQAIVDKEQWTKEILRLRNHPCIMVYCLGNEINNPGHNPEVKEMRELTRRLDPTRLFLDTSSRGEYDRDTSDIDVQHMSYFAPFGKNYHMFDDSIHLGIYGSVSDNKLIEHDHSEDPVWTARREIPVGLPVIAHEICHYNILRDPFDLEQKFKQYNTEKPWWIDELMKMIKAKGHQQQFQKMLAASTRFQYIWIKQGLESIRKSPLLQGFHFLQLSDTERYENANGLIDCFDDPKDIPPEKILPMNSPTVIIADLPRRTFMENTKIKIPILVSHYTERLESGTLKWELKSTSGKLPVYSGTLENCDLSSRGIVKLCRLEIKLPSTEKPEGLIFSCKLVSEDKQHSIANQWDLWLFPNRPQRVETIPATVSLHDLDLHKRYPQIIASSEIDKAEQLLITDHFDENVVAHLAKGKDVLVIYRIPENRDRKAPREKYYLPSTWERFKGTIWDRGHNCGGFLREHAMINDFPHEGFVDWQFYNLIEDSDKIDLDDFPVPVEPIIEGVDKAVRDRFDVHRFGLSEFQYEYTMRKFAYAFEVMVGAGRLLVTGMNFKGIERDVPEVCWMYESLMTYINSDQFRPVAAISVEEFRNYLITKGKAPRIKERMMTQYWQLDDAPLESKRYWKESEEWLRQED